MTAAHDFAASLSASHAASDWPGWEALYRDAFPTFAAMIDHREDGEHQRAGIDRSIVLRNSKQILVDEKVRRRSAHGRIYDDIFLETVSVRKPGRSDDPGWVEKEIRADYIAYLIAPLGKCYLLPTIQLQSAWALCGPNWRKRFGEREVPNHGYVTVGVPVPVKDLFTAIGDGLRLSCRPWEPQAA